MYLNNPSQKPNATNGISSQPEAESLENIEDRVQEAIRSTEALPMDTTFSEGSVANQKVYGDMHKSAPALLRVYKNNSKLRTALLCGILAAVIVGGFILIYKAQKNEDKNTFQSSQLNQQLEDENESSNIDFGDRTLGVGANLIVKGSSTLQGNASIGNNLRVGQDLVVEGQARLASLEVTGNTNINGQLTINGTVIAQNLQGSISGSFSGASRGSFSGNASGSFAGESTGTFKGLANGTFIGSFQGDGSQLTGINATSCANCVRLQGPSAINQTGDIALDGSIRARKVNLRAASNAVDTFTVETATGEKLISADTLNKNIKVGNLIPNIKESYTPGSFTPGYTIPGYTSNDGAYILTADTGGAYNDARRWVAKGTDGFLRFVYIDQYTSEVIFTRCMNAECTQSVRKVVASNPDDWTDTPSIALSSDDKIYISYIEYASPNVIHLVRCSDANCDVYTDEIIGTTMEYSYISVVTVGPDGLARVAYDDYNSWSANPRIQQLRFVQCLNTTCSSNNNVQIGPDDEQYYESIDLLTTSTGSVYISYRNPSTDSMTLTRCVSSDCSIHNNVNYGTINGYYISMAEDEDGIVHLIYEDENINGETINYASCLDTLCSSVSDVLIDERTDGKGSTISSLYFENGKPHFAYLVYQWSGSSYSTEVYMVTCTDEACSSFTSVSRPYMNVSPWHNMLTSITGRPTLVFLDQVTDRIKAANDVQIVVVPPVVVPDITVPDTITAGTTIGTAAERFGQIYSAGIDLQSVRSDPLLIVDRQTGLDATAGSIASFRVDGVETVSISSTGEFIVGGASADKQLRVDAEANLFVGYQAAFTGTPALLNLASSSNTPTKLLSAFSTGGAELLNIDADGNIHAGNTILCKGCSLPQYLVGTHNIKSWYSTPTLNGDVLYAYTTHHNITVYDVSDPLNPVKGVTFTQGMADSKIAIKDNYGYNFSYYPEEKLIVYDLSDKANPTIVTTVPTPLGQPRDIEVHGQYVYVISYFGELLIFDISNPLQPVMVSRASFGLNAIFGMEVNGDTIYIHSTNDVYAIDIAQPQQPLLVSHLQLTGQPAAGKVLLRGNYLLYPAFTSTGQVGVIDISDRHNPRQILGSTGMFTGDSIFSSMHDVGDVMYIVYKKDGLGEDIKRTYVYQYDISNLAEPVFVKSAEITTKERTSRWDRTIFVGPYLYDFGYATNKLNIYGSYQSTFQGLKSATLKVSSKAAFEGTIEVGGTARFSATTTIAAGADLVVQGLETPGLPSMETGSYDSLGRLSPGTYYYRISAINAVGNESQASNEFTFTPYPVRYSVPHTDASPGDPGMLMGDYRYRYTYVTAFGEGGEVSADSESNIVSVNGQKVSLSNIFAPQTSTITHINIYRCDAPLCASYNFVGSLLNPRTGSYVTYTDDNPIPGAAMPDINTAHTDTNYVRFSFTPVEGAVKYRIYRSTTSGSGYTYQEVVPEVNWGNHRITDWGALGTPGNPTGNSFGGRIAVGKASATKSLDVFGDALFKSSVNATSAFVIQNASAVTLLSADTVNQRIGVGLGNPAATLHISAASGTLFRVTDTTATARDVINVADGGATIFRNQTDSTTAFRIQNAAGATVLTINTTNLRVEIASGSDLLFAGAGNTRNALTKTFTCTTTEAVNDVVIITGSATVGRTTTANSNRVAGVVVAKPTTTSCIIAFSGVAQVNFGANATPAAIGDPVVTSSIAGMAQSSTAPNAGAKLGNSTSAKDGTNLVWVLLAGN